ncbi:uncharacterized protein [Ptychodera flava]|uniref:uncharacterized protein n=1 Tax=Ptychodera flava TaxID=63121 RepID=UPI00396A5DAB
MDFKGFLTFAVLAALVLTYCNASECPQSVTEFSKLRRWIASSVGLCYTQMLTSIRQDKTDCSDKVNSVSECLNTETEKCLATNTDDILEQMLQQSMVPFSATLPQMKLIFCDEDFSSTPEIAPTLQYGEEQQCSAELLPSSQTCSTTFDEHFRENPFNPQLCGEFDEVVDCQTEKAQEFCSNLEESYLDDDIFIRRKMNFFCGGLDETETSTGGNAEGGPAVTTERSGNDTTRNEDSATSKGDEQTADGTDDGSDVKDESAAVALEISYALLSFSALMLSAV